MQRLLTSYKTVEVIENTGNRGDGVINQGCRQYLTRQGIEIGKSDTCIFIGAGGFCGSYKHNINRLLSVAQRYRRVIVASATIDTSDKDVASLMQRLPSNVSIICRDRVSFNNCSRYTQNVMLDHDFAFYFDYEPYKKQGAGVLEAFRGDNEKTHQACRNDVSLGNETEWDAFVREIAEYDEVKTNRLHVAIVATMLGKKVTLYPNSYFKNRAVYEHSLAQHPNCTFKSIKYICVGNARTGTTSLESAFRLLGYKADGYHYDLVKQYLYGDKHAIIKRVADYDFVKDHPYVELWKELDAAYECKFILTTRDPQSWLTSYRRKIADQIAGNANYELRMREYGFNPMTKDDEYVINNIYEYNNNKILTYFNNRGDDLLVMDISDGWEKLCPFLGVPVPDTPFPHKNRG